MHNWLSNYLFKRNQFTVCNGVPCRPIPSEMGDIVCGVPQGSVLGPHLFLVYMNDMSRAVTDCCFKLFADDTIFFLVAYIIIRS